MKYNILQEKSLAFSIEIISFCKLLRNNKEFVLADQLLRSGTSIGANVEESIGAASTKDFLSKLTIAYKEARESKYWLTLIDKSFPECADQVLQLLNANEELLKIIGTIQIKTKSRIRPRD